VQQTKPARISIARRAHEYIPGLAGRHNGGTEDVRPIVHDLHNQNTLSDL